MSSSQLVSALHVEGILFPGAAKPPASTNSFFLAGAGVREMEINGKFVKLSAMGVFLEDKAVSLLADKWKGKSAAELDGSVEFFRDIVTGPFEKFTLVTMIQPLTGRQYSEKVADKCIGTWKELGIYTDAEVRAIEKFQQVFKNETFSTGTSIYTHLYKGSIAISISKHESMPEAPNCVIDNKLLCETALDNIIGKNSVFPEAKTSTASRLSELFNQSQKS